MLETYTTTEHIKTKRLTTAQTIIQFLLHQHVERDRRRQPFFAG